MPPTRAVRLRAHLVARTRFIDDEVISAIGRGVAQIVVLGAGYDDRALRFRSPGVDFFELDHPATQSDKRRRLRRMNADLARVTLAAVDFRSDDAAAVLARSGHDASRASLFVCEGLLVYLDQGSVLGLLAGLRSRAGTGSSLAASLAVHPDGVDSKVVVDRANAARPDGSAEPWLTILPAAGHLGLVTRSGWVPVQCRDDATLATGAVPGRSLCLVARPGATPLARTDGALTDPPPGSAPRHAGYTGA
jgi:methyltransferase (TIGR00027 family)